MLILTRRCAESLIIGDGEITVTVLGVKGKRGRSWLIYAPCCGELAEWPKALPC